MWKATATTDTNAIKNIKAQEDDDWDSDPDFVNAVSEKEQRWGKQKTIDTTENLAFEGDMAGLRQKVVQTSEETSNAEWQMKAQATKKSYGATGFSPNKQR